MVKTENVDGLGRAVSTLVSAPGGAIESDTTYDALNRVSCVTNPYISTPSGYYTCKTYDALSRPLALYQGSTSTSSPNGDEKQWSYSGLTTTATDEILNKSKATTDFLGRIVGANEPTVNNSTSTMLSTTYTYSVYGLTNVDQTGVSGETARTRYFDYDSLGRLTTAYNPETGAIGYSYPVSGTLCAYDPSLPCSKTDHRAVTTTYGYSTDGTHLLLSRTYSGSGSPATAIASNTPSSCYQYGYSGTDVTYGIGRLGAEWTYLGSCASSLPGSGVKAQHSIIAYDSLGRVAQERQCTLGVCSLSSPPVVAYNYDLAGKVLSYTNGMAAGTSGATSFTNQYDAAGRLLTVTSSWDDVFHPGLLFSAQAYDANGLTNANLGNHLTLQKTYDPRLRVDSETVLSH